MKRHIAWFVTPHGFGHAARSCAVMEALRACDPDILFDIYTHVPEWFFSDSLGRGFVYHPLLTDIGLVQASPFEEDLPATLAALEKFIPFSQESLQNLAEDLRSRGTAAAVSDVSALGIAAAHTAGIPSILQENFTWDWIYAGYQDRCPGFSRFSSFLREITARADLRLQLEPICQPDPKSVRISSLVSRVPRTPPETTRAALGVSLEEPLVLVTLGGIPVRPEKWLSVGDPGKIILLIQADTEKIEHQGNCIFIPHHSPFYHPDLIAASSAVVGKAGYSTLAETYNAGIPFGYILRSSFPETAFLAGFARDHSLGFEISSESLEDGSWVSRVPELLSIPRLPVMPQQGSGLIAEKILRVIT